MLSNTGNFLIILNILTTIFIIYFCYNSINSTGEKNTKKIYNLNLYQATFAIMTFVTLVTGFIFSDFSLKTVFENSHTLKPLFYKISGSWGNHEGSLLLWINIMVIFSFLFLIYNKQSDKKYRLYTLIAQNILILGFLIFLFFNSNPFSLVYPTPNEGLGLNPILQDPALAIHPPLLYVGFVGSSIYFSGAIASLLSSFEGRVFAKSIRPWVLTSWCFQTLGIIAGSIWAYYELGWGGFWFWDPVENASLMPWFVMTALMHSVIVLEKRQSLYPWVIILCLSTFTLSVTGTFLVRSGILNSVHTFANDPSRGLYILIFLSLMIFSALTIFFKNYKKEKSFFNINSKETFILANNWFMAFFLVTVLIGTTYPVFLEVINNVKISVGAPFYNIVIIPFIAPLLFIMAIGPNIKWIKGKFEHMSKFFSILAMALIINISIQYFFKTHNYLLSLVIISSIFLIIYTIDDLLKILRNNKNYFGISRTISHLGFGLLILFIGLNHNFSIEKDFNIKVGEKKSFETYVINFNSLELEKRKNHQAIIGNFYFFNNKDKVGEEFNPEIRIYKQPETLTYEASIRTKLSHDLYLTMSNIDKSDFYNIKFQKKPFMIWIWLSAIMISIGGFIRLFQNEN